ncbi:MAG: hypothetical protein HYT49_00095 [Candidatus Wildermuthbacteria bacterium]|nr:hypothetical protein [Candidatus Wildermuthbacteria bacterium]
MLVILLYFAIAFCFGYAIISRLKFELFLEEKIIWATAFGTFFQTLVLFLFSFLFGFTKFSVALFLSLIFVSAVLLIASRYALVIEQLKSDLFLFKKRLQTKKLNLFLVFALAALVFFATLWPTVFFSDTSGGISTIGTAGVWGDWALHAAYASHFAYSDNIVLSDPIFSGNPLAYTFLADFLSAALIKIGANFNWALVLPGFFFSMLFIGAFYYFVFRLTGRQNVALLSFLLFLFMGGLGAVFFFQDIQGLGGWDFSGAIDFLKTSTKEYTNLPANGIYWTAFLNSLFLPQRALNMGIVVGMLILTCLLVALQKKEAKYFLFAGIAAGLLPTLHLHTLLAISIVGGLLILLGLNFPSKISFRYAAYFSLPIAILGILQFLFLFPEGSQYIRIQLGWMAGKENWLLFWIKNLGLFFLLIPAALWFVDTRLRKQYLAFFALFLLSNIVVFQPYDYDNLKIFIYWFVLNAVIFSTFLVALWKKNIFGKIAAPSLGILLVMSSLLDTVSLYLRSSYPLFSKEDIALAETVKNETHAPDIFLTSDKHNNPILALSGRSLVMGYRGWLWSHGIDYKERERDVFAMFQGAPNAKELLKKYKVSYVVIGAAEKKDFAANEIFYSQNYPLFIDENGIKIYKVSNPE